MSNDLGKEIRLARLFNPRSGRFLGITMDHTIPHGVLPGLERIGQKLGEVVEGKPDAVTLQKGIAEKCFGPFAGRVGLIVKCTSYSPYHKTKDVPVAEVEEVVRLGATAAAVGCFVCGTFQDQQLEQLGRYAREARRFGMPLVAHIYPRGEHLKPDEYHEWKHVAYAVRCGSELGVDVIKTLYTGSAESFSRVVEASTVPVVVAGGVSEDGDVGLFLRQTQEALEAGAKGVAYGRRVWQSAHPALLIEALRQVLHEGIPADEAAARLESARRTDSAVVAHDQRTT